MFIVMITASEGSRPEPIGPFPDLRWAKRYVERVAKRYFKLDIQRLISPRLIGLEDPSNPDSDFIAVFDPAEGIDK